MDARREKLLNQLTDFFVNQNQIKVSAESESTDTGFEKKASMLKTASDMLKYAAKRTRDLEESNERLASENKILHARIEFEQRKMKAEKLAGIMHQKGLIKHAEISDKAAEISIMDEVGFEILKSAVENLHVEKIASFQGIDNLTFLDRQLNIDSEDSNQPTFVQTIASMI